MANTIRDLLVRVGVQVDGAQLDELNANVEKFKGSLKQLGVVVGAVTGALGVAVGFFARAGNAAAKSADQAGETVERYQELSHAAERAGVTQEQLNNALRFGNVLLYEADRGTKTAAERFRALGIDIHNANGSLKTSGQILPEVADAIVAEEDAAKAAAMASRIFGEEAGPKLVPLLKQGSIGVEELAKRAHLLGKVIDEDAARAAEAFGDNLADLWDYLMGLRNVVGATLLGPLDRLVNKLLDLGLASREAVASRIEVWAERLGRMIDFLTLGLDNLDAAVTQVFGGWGTFIDAAVIGTTALIGLLTGSTILSAIGVLKSGFVALQGLLAAMGVSASGVGGTLAAVFSEILAPVLAVVAVVASFVLLMEDFLSFLRGDVSVLGEFFERAGIAQEVLDVVGLLRDAFVELGGVLVVLGGAIASALGAALGDLLRVLDQAGLIDFAFQAIGFAIHNSILLPLRLLAALISGISQGIQTMLGLLSEGGARFSDFDGVLQTLKLVFLELVDLAAQLFDLSTKPLQAIGGLLGQAADTGIGRAVLAPVNALLGRQTSAATAPAAPVTNRSSTVNLGGVTTSINGGAGPDAEAAARRINAEAVRELRANFAGVGSEA